MRTGSIERAWLGLRCGILGIAAGGALLLASLAASQPIEEAPEQSIKAAYLYNFAAYVHWPERSFGGPQGSLKIGILGDDLLARELEQITRERRVRGRRIEVRRLRVEDPVSDLHILFIAEEFTPQLPALTAEARTRSVLIVTESGDALNAGGVINFLLIDQRVRFEVSLEAADASGLSISSRLLAVAEHVLPRGGG